MGADNSAAVLAPRAKGSSCKEAPSRAKLPAPANEVMDFIANKLLVATSSVAMLKSKLLSLVHPRNRRKA